MSLATPELLAQPSQHESMAHLEQQVKDAQQLDYLHTHPEGAHAHEGHVCTASCEHSQVQANKISNELFADKEIHHVCGSTCEHHHTDANKISDKLFNDLDKPSTEATQPKVEAAKTTVDMHAANKTATELDHHEHQETKHHVCDASCEHSQSQANKHANSLFEELNRSEHVSHITAHHAVKEQNNTVTHDVTSQHIASGFMAEQASRLRTAETDAAFRQYAEASEAAQVINVMSNEEATNSDTQLPAASPQERRSLYTSQEASNSPKSAHSAEATHNDHAVNNSPYEFTATKNETKTSDATDGADLLVVPEGADTITFEQVKADVFFEPTPLEPEATLASEIATEQTAVKRQNFGFEVVELPTPLAQTDEVGLSEVVADVDMLGAQQSDAAAPSQEATTTADAIQFFDKSKIAVTELNTEKQARVNKLATLVQPEVASEVLDVINDIFSIIKSTKNIESAELSFAKVSEIKQKLTELADMLSIDYAELAKMLQVTERIDLAFDQQAYDIMRGLLKNLSIEYSSEFSQFSSVQSGHSAKTPIQALGQFILFFLTRRPPEAQLLAA